MYFDSSMCRLHILYRISTVRVKSAWPGVAPRVPDNPKSWHCYDALPSDIISHEISKRVPAQHHDMGKKTTDRCHNDYYCQKSQAVFVMLHVPNTALMPCTHVARSRSSQLDIFVTGQLLLCKFICKLGMHDSRYRSCQRLMQIWRA